MKFIIWRLLASACDSNGENCRMIPGITKGNYYLTTPPRENYQVDFVDLEFSTANSSWVLHLEGGCGGYCPDSWPIHYVLCE